MERSEADLLEVIRIAMAAVVAPGMTVVVTPDTLRSGGAEKKMTVMTGRQ